MVWVVVDGEEPGLEEGIGGEPIEIGASAGVDGARGKLGDIGGERDGLVDGESMGVG